MVGQCDYIVTLRPPPGVEGKIPRLVPPVTPQQLSWLFQIPVRMCVLEGSELAGTRAAGDTIAGSGLMALLESVNQDIWFPQAQIAFSSVIETGVPVIADPTPPSAIECGRLGDLAVAGFALEDAPDAERACAAAWENRYPGRHGIPVIFARAFCDSGSILGGAPPPDRGLYVAGASPLTGRRGDDLCGVPKHLTQDDIINESRSPFVVLVEPARLNADTARNNLAHELGHNLFLGHGNGFDDNMDGMPAGRAGPKRYDEYCDPAWLRPPDNEVLVEDEPTPFTNCEELEQPDEHARHLPELAATADRNSARRCAAIPRLQG